MSRLNQPLSGNKVPRFAGIATMFRLPAQNDARDLDVAIVGVPLDIGTDRPMYLTFDIDGLDPSAAPSTGTPEPGGLMTSQGLEIIRGSRGLNLVGCDLGEISPPYDPSGNTALPGSNLVFETLCVLPGCRINDDK